MEASAQTTGVLTRQGSRRSLVILLIGLLIVCASFCILALPDRTVDSLVREDDVVEWSGAIGLFVGTILLLAAFRIARRDRPAWMTPGGVWMLLASAGVLFLMGGEEISWGQRLFGWGTPGALSSANKQDETNLHNLAPFQGGEFDSGRLFRLACICFFLLLPVAARLWPRIRRAVSPRLLIPPAWMAGVACSVWIASKFSVDAFEGTYHGVFSAGNAATEIQEALIESLLGIWALMTLMRVRRADAEPAADAAPSAARDLARVG